MTLLGFRRPAAHARRQSHRRPDCVGADRYDVLYRCHRIEIRALHLYRHGKHRFVGVVVRAYRLTRHSSSRWYCSRERDHEYSVEDLGADFIIRTNWQAPNFRIMRAPIESAGDRSTWRDVIAHRGDIPATTSEVFRGFPQLWRSAPAACARSASSRGRAGPERLIDADEAAYTAMFGASARARFRACCAYTYSSLTTPTTTYDYDLRRDGSRTLLKRDPVATAIRFRQLPD